MKKTVNDIISILDHREKSRAVKLIVLDVLVSLLDIAFLAGLIFVIHFYTLGNHTSAFTFFPFSYYKEYPLALILTFFILFAVKNALAYQVFKMQYRFVYAVASRLSKRNLLHFLQGNYNDYADIDSSVHIRRISYQPIEFGHHVLAGLQQVIGQTVLLMLTSLAIFIYDPFLFLLIFVMLTPAAIIINSIIKRKAKHIRETAKPVREKTLQYLQESLSGYVESNVFQRNHFFADRYIKQQAAFNDFLSQQLVVQNVPARFVEVFAIFGLLGLIVFNFYSNNSGSVQLVSIGAFMAGAYKIIPGITKILNSIGQIKTYSYTIADLAADENIKTEPEEKNVTAISSVAMKNIFFGYKQKKILSNFSLEMKRGDFIGLSGISGKGKTTIINLLLGFLNPQEGSILVNDTITTIADRENYRKNISYVKQDSFLIHDSILTNITLTDGDYDKQRVADIAAVTGLDKPANQNGQGLNSIVTENGKNISGGQRQRIALARALYKDAELLILDEPFNELDRVSENNLLKHCQKLAADGKIIILVSHDQESLSFCNKIISVDENAKVSLSYL